MRKNTLLLKKERKLEWNIVFDSIIGLLLGFCVDQRMLALAIVYLCNVYERGIRSYIGYSVMWIVSSYRIGIRQTLVCMVASILFLLIKKVYDTLHYSMYKHVFLINTLLVFLSSYFLYGVGRQTFVLMAIGFGLSFTFTYLTNGEEYKLRTFTCLSIAYLYFLLLGEPYVIFIQFAYVVVSAYLLPISVFSLLLFYFVLLGFPPMYGLYLMFVVIGRKHIVFLSLLSWLALLFDFELYTIFFATLCSFMGLLSYESKDHFMEKSKLIEKEHQIYMEHSFYRQIVNYASIFHNLSHYYEDLSDEQAQMLKLMGDALEYNARLSKQYIYAKSEMKIQIKELLKGYHFTLLDCDVKTWEEGIMIHLEMEHLYEGELEEVILPLIEKVCQSRLHISKFHAYPLCRGKYRIIMESEVYPKVTTYGDSVHVHEVCGDTYHSFHNDPHTILMLSDGMGKGIKAKKTSTILIQIMETMMRSNIPQVECIKMMNLFLRSDIYATLDVLSFDRRNYKAYLSKAASAPTYLLRDDTLYEMNAHSLPIGIVDYVNADIYEISYQKGDIFIMASDGVDKQEIEKWKSLKRCVAVKNEVINLMSIIKEHKRKDDSTVLLAKID